MSKSVEERVVQMGFENKDFESNAKTTMSTIDKLKKSLNFDGASKSFDELNRASKGINLSNLISSVETVSSRFSTLGIIGTTALQNITNEAINTARNLVNQLTLSPIMDGFREYETQIGAIQTILANTSAQGTTLEQVTAALDELNLYADKTIYNFTEMTRNIGTFTAAGVDLKTSTEAIKGIANLAAMSGSTSQQASTAMYQLSQALAAGRVSLQDWNSVVNAGMGGKVFQEALMQTAEAMGIVVDRTQSFRESISATGGQDSWLTSDVLLNTLRQFTGDLSDAELAAMGFNEAQVKAIQAQAETANKAATEVKTLTQLFDTMKESVTSGWTETWEIIIGDFGEAKSLFTNVSNVFGEFVSNMSNARNDLLRGGLMSGWKQFLNEGITNQDDFLGSVREAMDAYGYYEGFLDDLIETHGSFEESLKSGWMTTDILSDSVARYTERLNGMSEEELEAAGYTGKHVEELNKFNEEIQNGTINLDEFLTKMTRSSGRENIIEGLNQAFRVLLEVITPVKKAFDSVFEAIKPEELYQMTVNFKEFFEGLSLGEENAKNLESTFKGLFSIFDMFGRVVSTIFKSIFGVAPEIGNLASKFLELTGSIGEFIAKLNESSKVDGIFSTIGESIKTGLSLVLGTIDELASKIGSVKGVLTSFGSVISKVFDGVFSAVGKVFSWIRENISAGDIFAGLAGGGIFVLAKKLSDLVGKIKEVIESFTSSKAYSLKENIGGVLDSVHDSLESFQQGIKVASIVGIAAAVAILVSSVEKLSEISPEKIAKSLVSIKLLIMSLTSGFKSLQKTLQTFASKGSLSSSVTLLALAKSVDILASALQKLSDINFGQLVTGLVGVGGIMAELVIAFNFLDKKSGVSLRSSVAILALSVACEKLSAALIPLSKLSWDEIQRGLVAMGGALAEFTVSMSILQNFSGMGSVLGAVGIIIAAQSMYTIAANLETLGSMSWEEIKKGLVAMGVALGEFTAALGILSSVGGFGSILGGAGILVASQSLYAISVNLEKLGSMSWDEIGRGLTAMGIALGEFTAALGILSSVGGFGSILGGTAILIAAQSLYAISENLERLSSLSWDEIQRGLVAMGGALAELGIVSGVIGSLSGLSGLVGATTLVVAVQSLDKIADSLFKLGFMSWEEIKKGLVAMGVALAEVAVISGALGALTGIAGLVGAGTLALAISGLDELATALEKFGSMSWDEIGRGLTAMGGALGETALGGLANTFSGIGAMSIDAMVEPLGELADSIKKWAGVKVPDDIGLQLQKLASGVNAFMFSGSGADSIVTIAVPLGDLADSIKNWSGVSIRKELGDEIASLASGVNAFFFSGWGADAIATIAIPLGDLANSIKNWSDVTLPNDIGTQMTSLASGVNAFMFSGWGADNMTSAAPALASLADAISKWSAITLPEDLGGQIKSLADGVNAFSFAFVAGYSIDTICQPLINLADSVLKWKDVSVPSTLKDDLTSLADGIKSFSFAFAAGFSIGTVTGPLSDLADSVNKWTGIDVSGVGPQLKSLSDGVSAFSNSGISDYVVNSFSSLTTTLSSETMATASQNISNFADALTRLSSIDMSFIAGIQQAFANFSTVSINTISQGFATGIASIIPNFQMMAFQIVTTLTTSFMAQLPKFTTTAILIGDTMIIALNSKNHKFLEIGTQFGSQLSSGIISQVPNASASAKALGDASLSQLQALNEPFKLAGENAGAGFVEGLNEYAEKAAEAAANIAKSAINAVNRALDAHSPSRKMKQSGIWGGEGLVLGFEEMYSPVKASAYKLGDTAVASLTNAIERARSVMISSSELEPTICPIVDLSDVKAKSAMINSEFAANRKFSIQATANKVFSASSGMTSRQNGKDNIGKTNSNEAVSQNFNFTQNNYSPKSLSRTDIYRQTKNQFSMAKEAVFRK